MSPNFNLINHLAIWAAAAYRQCTVSDPGTDAEAVVTLDGDRLIVAFRGSSSAKDFLADARFALTELLRSQTAPTAKVHRGFLAQFESINCEVVEQVRSYLTLAPQAGVYLTGHSLGGALAILCALEFQRQNLPVAGVVTFGQPRVGNRAFAQLYDSAPVSTVGAGLPPSTTTLKDLTWCVVNAGDPVPLLPPLLNGYRDCGTEVFVTRHGEIKLAPGLGWELVTDLLGALECWRRHRLGLLPNHCLHAYQSALDAVEIIPPQTTLNTPSHDVCSIHS